MNTDPTFASSLTSAILALVAVFFPSFDVVGVTPVVLMVVSGILAAFAAYSRKRNANSPSTSNTADINPLRLS